MATTLSSITQTAALYRSADAAATKRGGSAVNPLNAASQRVTQQLSSTVVKLSSFSQLKSGFASVQAAAKDLSDPKKTGTSADIVKAAQAFSSAYNTATKAVSLAVNGDGKKSGALAGDGRASIASNDLKSIVASGSNASELKKIGINQKADGTISVDTVVLQNAIQTNPNAVKGTLAKIGKQADQISTKELGTTGNVGGSINNLDSLSKSLESQSASLKKLGTALQDSGQSQVASSIVSGAIKTYLQIFSL